MSLIKKCDVKQYFATHPHRGHHPLRSAKKSEPNSLSVSVPDDARANASGFVEDFSLEHSSPGAPLISISISACTESVVAPAIANDPKTPSAIPHSYPKAS